MIHAVLLVIALGVSALAAAQLPSPLPEVAADVARVERYPAHDVVFPNGVTGIPGLVYWEPVAYRPLTLDLYLPPSAVERPATGFPLISSADVSDCVQGGVAWSGCSPLCMLAIHPRLLTSEH